MFEQATLSSGPAAKRVWTTIAGVTGQATIVTFMILVPMIWPDVLPQARALVTIVAPPPPSYKPPAGTTSVQTRGPRAIGNRPVLPWQPPVAPISVPKGVPIIIDDAPVFAMTSGGPDGPDGAAGMDTGVIGGITGLARALPPPPPKAPPATFKPTTAPAPARIVQTSQLDPAQILHRVDPVYPEMAKRMRVSGTVQLRGIVGTDGRIRELQVLSGNPLLVKAAVDAVSQWIYKPTRLSGQPVEVDAPISVIFHLN